MNQSGRNDQPPTMQKYRMPSPDEEKLSDALGWPLFHRVDATASSAVRTPYYCESLTVPYQAPLQVNDECGSMRKAFRTDALRPTALKAELLRRSNRIAWIEQLARVRRAHDRFALATSGATTSLYAPTLFAAVESLDGGVNLNGSNSATSAAASNAGTVAAAEAFPVLRAGVATQTQIDAFFTRLASTVSDDPLSSLRSLLQHGFPKEQKLIDAFAARAVPLSRAVWLVRVLQLNAAQAPQHSKAAGSASPAALLTDVLVKALASRLSASAPTSDAQAEWVARVIYVVRLIEWLYHERLLDEKLLFEKLVELFAQPPAPHHRKLAVLCYVLQPLLARMSRLPTAVECALVQCVCERLQELQAANALAGALARALRALLRTAMLAHPPLVSPFALDPARRRTLHSLAAPPHVSASPTGMSIASPPTPSSSTTLVVSSASLSSSTAAAPTIELASCAAAATLNADMHVRELNAVDCVHLPWTALAAQTLDRVPAWLDAFAGAPRLKKQLAPLAAATHLGDTRYRAVMRRALEWAVTPQRGGRDRAHVAAVAIDSLLADAAYATKPAVPAWVQSDLLRFLDDCIVCAAGANFEAVIWLFAELFRKRILSYQAYMRTLIARGYAPQLSSLTADAAAFAVSAPRVDYAPLVHAASAGAICEAAQRVVEQQCDASRVRAAPSVVVARHAHFVRQTPILERTNDDDHVRIDRSSRAQMLLARAGFEKAEARATALVDTFVRATAADIASPHPAALLEGMALHEQTRVAREAARLCWHVWPTLVPTRLQWVVGLIEHVGCVVTLLEAMLLLLQQCTRDNSPSRCEPALLDALKRHEAAFVWCDRAVDLVGLLSRQPRLRTLSDAFQRRYPGAMPSVDAATSGKANAAQRRPATTRVQTSGAASALQLAAAAADMQRAPLVACLAPSDPPLPRQPHEALEELGKRGPLLPSPAFATECAALASRASASEHATLRAVVLSGEFQRLLALSAADAQHQRPSTTTNVDESSDAPVLNAAVTGVVDAAFMDVSLLPPTVSSVALARAVVLCVLRADVWNSTPNAAILRAFCDAAAANAPFVDTLLPPLPPLSAALPTALARVYRFVSRYALVACVIRTCVELAAPDGARESSADGGVWAVARVLLAQAGGAALVGALLREVLSTLNDDSLIHHEPYRLPAALLMGEQVGADFSDIALHDAVMRGVLRLVTPVIRELRSSAAPQSLLVHTCQQLVLQLRKWHQVTTGYVDVLGVSDENLSALHTALVLRIELAACTVPAIRAAHLQACARDCVCGWQALFDALVELATNSVLRIGAADDDALLLLCTSALRCLIDGTPVPPPRDARLAAALQRHAAVPAFVDVDEAVLRASDEQRRKQQSSWTLLEGYTPLLSVLSADAFSFCARAPPRFAPLPAQFANTVATMIKRTAAEDALLFAKRARIAIDEH